MTLSMFAATAGHLETVKCLKRLGANLRKPCFIDHDLICGQRVQASVMSMACYEGRENVVKWLVDECGIGKCESEIVVVDPAYIEHVTKLELAEEAKAKEAVRLARARDAQKNRAVFPYGRFVDRANRPLPYERASRDRDEPTIDVQVENNPQHQAAETDLLDAFAGPPTKAMSDVTITVETDDSASSN